MSIKIKKTISEKQVIELHDMILDEEPGLPGLCDSRPLSSALNRINHHISYGDVSDIYEVAALYAIAIACGHPFNDGNKRTAVVTMMTFLLLNGINMTADDKEIENIIVDVADNKVDMKKLAKWLKERSH